MRSVVEAIGAIIFFSLPIVFWYGSGKLPNDIYKIYKKYNVMGDYLSIYNPFYTQLNSLIKNTTNEALKKELVDKKKLISRFNKLWWLLVALMLLIFYFKDKLPN